MEQLLDLCGFVSVALHAAELAASTALLGGVALWALLLPALAPRLPADDHGRLQSIGRRAVPIGAAAALAAKLAGGGHGLLALAATLEAPAAGVFGADFVLALAAALLAVAALGLLALPRGAPGPGRRAALLDSTGKVPVARHRPLLFLPLALFTGVRAAPEAWPLGGIGFLDSLRFVFPGAMLAGGLLLLSHTDAIASVREALPVELSHLPVAVLAVVGGRARWTELRGPPELARPAAAVWPACLVLIGVLLLIHREA